MFFFLNIIVSTIIPIYHDMNLKLYEEFGSFNSIFKGHIYMYVQNQDMDVQNQDMDVQNQDMDVQNQDMYVQNQIIYPCLR